MKSPSQKTALAVVAHPDDETIFLGGTILSYSEYSWRILCATYERNDMRAVESLRAEKYYRASGIQIDFGFLGHRDARKEENGGVDFDQLVNQLRVYASWPDIVISHNELGDYCHKAHIAVFDAVNRVFENPWVIICDGSRDFPIVQRPEYWHIPLTEETRKRKLQIFTECYPSQQHLWHKAAFIVNWAFNRQEEVLGRNRLPI